MVPRPRALPLVGLGSGLRQVGPPEVGTPFLGQPLRLGASPVGDPSRDAPRGRIRGYADLPIRSGGYGAETPRGRTRTIPPPSTWRFRRTEGIRRRQASIKAIAAISPPVRMKSPRETSSTARACNTRSSTPRTARKAASPRARAQLVRRAPGRSARPGRDRGAASRRAASRDRRVVAAATISALRNTIPAPPRPVTSMLRCRSRARRGCLRLQPPDQQASAARQRLAEGPGNLPGTASGCPGGPGFRHRFTNLAGLPGSDRADVPEGRAAWPERVTVPDQADRAKDQGLALVPLSANAALFLPG